MNKIKKTSSLNNDLLNSYSEFQQSIKLFYEKYKDKSNQEEANRDLKELIIEYLNFKLGNGEKWIKGLIYIIKKHQFLSQQILSSIFYLDIYDIIIKPKCLGIKLKEKLYPQSKIFHYEIIQNDINNKDIIVDEEINKYKIKRQESYELFEVIKRQLEYKENPFNIVINNFILYFTEEVKNKNEYLDKINNKNNYENYCNKIIDELKDQINEFVIFLTKCITIFYKINNIQEYDTYYALLISIIFNGKGNSKKLYQLFMELIIKKEKNKIELFKNSISFCKEHNLSAPKDFLVEKKFCLDNDTRKLFDKMKLKENHIININYPYEKTINDFKKIEKYQNPFDKLLLTYNLRKIISEEISTFWSQVDEEELKKENINLNIEADDFINIFKFILIKGEIKNICAEISFIESFTSNQIKQDSEWYYLSLIQVSLMQLEEMKNN